MGRKRLGRRLVQLYIGLLLYGLSGALLVRSRLGLDPWDVLHQGIARHSGLAIGTVLILVGAAVLVLWIPLRQWPGLGTVSNVVLIGVSMNLSLQWLPHVHLMVWRIGDLLGGVLLCGVATGMYIGANLGAGPRDGLMTGLAKRTGRSIRLTRTAIEVTVLAIGWALGGTVGVGTVVFAVAIGPLAQLFMPIFDVTRGLLLVVGPGEPRREPVDRGLEIGVGVDEALQPIGQPRDAHGLLATALDELFDPSVGEVHADQCPSRLEA
jgi:uncharacterized membrane protein YczE